jgi:hypothetical protein
MARDKFCTLPTPAEGQNLQLEFGAAVKVRPERPRREERTSNTAAAGYTRNGVSSITGA